MGRTHFYHVVARKNPSTNEFEPLANVLVSVFTVNNAGTEGGSATVYSARTGSSTPADMLTEANGSIEFFLPPGDFNVHFADTVGPARITSFVVGVSSVVGADGGIPPTQLANGIVATQLAGEIPGSKLTAAAGITNGQLAGGIAAAKLAGSITSDQLLGNITAAKLLGSIPLTKMDSNIEADLRTMLCPVVTTLPASPDNNQEVIWRPSSATMGAAETPQWHMKYDSATGKWWFIGGSWARTVAQPRNDIANSGTDATGAINPSVNQTPGTNLEWISGNRLTIPKAGDWSMRTNRCSVRNQITGSGSPNAADCNLHVRGGGFAGPNDRGRLLTGAGAHTGLFLDGVSSVASDGLATWLSHETSPPADDTFQIWNEFGTLRYFIQPIKITP